jgi:adenylate cyclase
MKKLLQISLLFVLFFLAFDGFGQDTTLNFREEPAVRAEVDSLCALAGQSLSKGDLAGARTLAEKALSVSERADDRKGKAECYYLLGKVAEKEGDLPMALRNYFTALREFEWSGAKAMLSATYVSLGDIYRSGGLYSKASENYRKASQLWDDHTSRNVKIDLEEKLAGTYYLTGDYDSALVLYQEIYGYYNQDQPETAMPVLMQVTSCLYRLERFSEALDYNQAALEIAREKSSDPMKEIQALNSLGYNYQYLKDYKRAQEQFAKACSIAADKYPGSEVYLVALVNLAIAQQNAGDVAAAFQSFFHALEIAEKQNFQAEEARIAHLVSYVYFLQKDYYNAGIYNRRANNAATAAGDEALLQNIYLMASMISTSLYDYEQGMIYYQKYLSLRDSLDTRSALEQQELSQQAYTVEKTEKELAQILYERELQGMELKNLRIEGEKKQQELELLRKTADLQNVTIQNQELEKNRTLQELLLAEEKLAAEKKDREIKDLKVEQQLQESELKRNELEQIRKDQEIQVLTKDKELNELTIQKIRARNIFLAGIVLLSLIILGLMIRWLLYSRKTNRILSDQRNKIQQQKEAIESQYDIIFEEREKSEKLLLNILPEETATELKEKGHAIPRHYTKVSVLFTDFVGFTKVAEKMTPEELINELDTCFMAFDHIIDKHNLEKIKTIGDAYMCAGGIPVENDSNPLDAVAAALEIKAFMDRTTIERNKEGKEYWQCRIGIHTGQVVAGVVGKNKFAYDIWGDAVNTASRMESSGEANRVNISGTTYELVKDHYHCVYRGKVYAKNKGEIDMYFVEGKK